MQRFVYSRDEDVRRVYAAKLRYERRVAERRPVPEPVQRRRVLRDVHAGRHDVQRSRRPDVRFDRNVAGRCGLRESGVRQRRLCGSLHARCDAVLEQQRSPDVRRRRAVVGVGVLRDSGVRRRRVRGRVRAGSEALFRERRRDVLDDGPMGGGLDVFGASVSQRRVHG